MLDVLDVQETEDGSLVLLLQCDVETVQFLLDKGISALVKESIVDTAKDEDDWK
jgi:hypothetical protein